MVSNNRVSRELGAGCGLRFAKLLILSYELVGQRPLQMARQMNLSVDYRSRARRNSRLLGIHAKISSIWTTEDLHVLR